MPTLDEINRRNLEEASAPVKSKKSEYLLPSEDILVDYSKYQPYLGESTSLNLEQWDDARAKAQSGSEKVFNSLGQMAGTFGTALASTVATLGGAAVGA
jgi:hypothetical protein